MASGTDAPAAARSLAIYLRAHPAASDVAEGIRRWWFPEPDTVTEEELDMALIWMQVQGLIAGTVAADGRVRFRRTGSDAQLDLVAASGTRRP